MAPGGSEVFVGGFPLKSAKTKPDDSLFRGPRQRHLRWGQREAPDNPRGSRRTASRALRGEVGGGGGGRKADYLKYLDI